MISMDFLKNRVDGLEFMEFQSDDFYRKTSEHLAQHISYETGKPVLQPSCVKELKELIKAFTGFSNITFEFTTSGNLGVDIGYFSPNHVFNNEGVEFHLKSTQTTLYRWFAQNKSKVFKGTVDYRTGKVTGAFQTIPVKMSINTNLADTFPKDAVGKFGVPLEGIVAGAIAHEMGHVFGGCMMLHTTCSDNLLAKAGLSFFNGVATEEERVVVLQDTAALLDVPKNEIGELQSLAKNKDEAAFMLYYNKLLTQRNTRRSLSVGVERMSSEVVADMYAIRMGCDKGIIAAIGVLVDKGAIQTVLSGLLTSTVVTLMLFNVTLPLTAMAVVAGAGLGAVLGFFGLVFILSFILDYFGKGYSGSYNAGHRRFDDALRQLIARLKEDKSSPSSVRADAIKEIERLLKINETLKPWYESTAIYRSIGWIFSGTDFKLTEIEHYTNVLSHHELNVLSDQLREAGGYTINERLARLTARRDPDNIEA